MKFIMLSVMLLSGCGKIDRIITHWTGDLTYKCSRHGIEYVQSDSGLALSIGSNGSPATCEVK